MSSSPPGPTGRTYVVTGASRGIGKAAARRLAELGGHVVLMARDPAATASAAAEVREAAAGGQVDAYVADFASLAEVRRVATQILAAHPRIDALVNNAGLWMNRRAESADGIELSLAVNHLAPFLLTGLLLPALRAADAGRIVSVASVAHRLGKVSRSDLMLERHYVGVRAYARSKLANILFTRELARRLQGSPLTANCCCPGAVRTQLGRDPGLSHKLFGLAGPFQHDADAGADTPVWLATSPEVAGRSGGYYARRRLRAPSARARDDEMGRWLWQRSAELVGLNPC